MKLAFAINMYENIDELKICTESIKYFWPDSYISINCNNKNLNVEDFSSITYDNLNMDYLFEYDMNYPSSKDIRMIEGWDRLTKDCINNSNGDYIIYIHNDCIFLSDNGIINIIENMGDKNFASQSLGITVMNNVDSPALSDLFFIANLNYLKCDNIFNFEPSELCLLEPSIHQFLFNTIRYRCGLSNVFIYHNHDFNLNINGTNKNIWVNAWADTYNPKFKYIHCKLQGNEKYISFYLKLNNINSPFFDKFKTLYDKNLKLNITNNSNIVCYSGHPNKKNHPKNLKIVNGYLGRFIEINENLII